jgi:restriction endonuclease S subunit
MIEQLNDINRLKKILDLTEKQLSSSYFKLPSLEEDKARVEVMRDQLEQMIVEKEKEIEQFEKHNGE